MTSGVRWTYWSGRRWREASRETCLERMRRKGVARLCGMRVSVQHDGSPDELYRLYGPDGVVVVDFTTLDSLEDAVGVIVGVRRELSDPARAE